MALIFFFTLVKVVDAIVECTCIENIVGSDTESLTCLVCLLPPAEVALGTSLLWADVWEELLVGSLCVDTDVLRILAVDIVFNWSTTVEVALIHVVRQLHEHTEAEHA